jgi:RimJ/RimL family protein N-acetyltransferase
VAQVHRRQGCKNPSGCRAIHSQRTCRNVRICGLIKRESLQYVDLGFAFLPRFWHNGYAYEAAIATLSYGKNVLGLPRIVAIVSQDNLASSKLLEKLGFRFERLVALNAGEEELKALYGYGLI